MTLTGGCFCAVCDSRAPWDHIGGTAPQFESHAN